MYLKLVASLALALHPAAHNQFAAHDQAAARNKPAAQKQTVAPKRPAAHKPAAASKQPAAHKHATAHGQKALACKRTYTVPMALDAIDATYTTGLPASQAQVTRLLRYIRCQRNPAAQQYLRRVWRVKSKPPMEGPAVASWYYDAGGTGCGFHATYGIATLIAPCGSRFEICNGTNCIVATRDDSGPYVGGRTFDLDPTSRSALGCGGLCSVTYRLLG